MKNTLVVSGIVALVVSILVAFLTPKNTPTQPVGAVASPDIMSPYVSIGGVRTWYAQTSSLASASTTCALQSPASTSTLVANLSGVRFALASTSASMIELGKATDRYSTTTSLGLFSLGASAQGTIVSTTTSTNGLDGTLVFAPNSYFTVKLGGGGTGSLPSGDCQAIWVEN